MQSGSKDLHPLHQASKTFGFVCWENKRPTTCINDESHQTAINLFGGTRPFTGTKPNIDCRSRIECEHGLFVDPKGNDLDRPTHHLSSHLPSITIFDANS